jgi:hypothetical protein
VNLASVCHLKGENAQADDYIRRATAISIADVHSEQFVRDLKILYQRWRVHKGVIYINEN